MNGWRDEGEDDDARRMVCAERERERERERDRERGGGEGGGATCVLEWCFFSLSKGKGWWFRLSCFCAFFPVTKAVSSCVETSLFSQNIQLHFKSNAFFFYIEKKSTSKTE